MLGWDTVDQHVRLRGDNGWVDETEEEKAANKRAYRKLCCLRIFALTKK